MSFENMGLNIIFLILVCYLIGSIPTAYLIGKIFKGIDISKYGSGNPGATNVFRVIGTTAGIMTLIIDFLKGFIPVFIVSFYEQSLNVVILSGICLILGHIFSIFLNFIGGKGVATACGVCMVLIPLETIFALLVFLIVVILTRYISAGSILATIFLTAIIWITHQPFLLCLFITFAGLVIILRHKNNIIKIFNKTENKL